jgi:RHH-type proline utilization regulon transcriptional repressor/proline dehydrogenase/delta 1-pyrroline-5-carboxylate dehydrogenase
VFGPILHVVCWRADRLDALFDELGNGDALTLGVHSRIDATVNRDR